MDHRAVKRAGRAAGIAMALAASVAAACDCGGDESPHATPSAVVSPTLETGSMRQYGLQVGDVPAEFRVISHQSEDDPAEGKVESVVSIADLLDSGTRTLADLNPETLYQRNIGKTMQIIAIVSRASDRDALDALLETIDPPNDGVQRTVLRAVDDERDPLEVMEDYQRSWVERSNVRSTPAGLGDRAALSSTSLARLDYDDITNSYRSERKLYRLNTETYTFVVGRYVVYVTRTAAMPDASMPSDVDLEAIARVLYARVSTAP